MAAEKEAIGIQIVHFTIRSVTRFYMICVSYALIHNKANIMIIYFIPYINDLLGKRIPSNIQSTLLFHQREVVHVVI